jgi:preprotein translocase subunit SecE
MLRAPMTNTREADAVTGPADTALMLAASVTVVAGIAAYYYFEGAPILLRVLAVLAGLGIGAALFFRSQPGQALWHFIQGSRVEMRKVVWPTRQEAMQTTLAVMFFVLVFGVFFWAMDLLLLFLSRTLTGQGG